MRHHIGKTVGEVRQAAGLAPDALARVARISLERLAEIERGHVPSVGELVAIASSLGVEPAALRGGPRADDLRRSPARFRAPLGYASLTANDVRLLAVAAEAARVSAFLGGLLNEPLSPVAAARQVVPVRPRPEPWEQGYERGLSARVRLELGSEPIASVQRLLEGLGVHIAFVAFESNEIAAASLYEEGASPVIILNAAHPRVAEPLPRRSVLAHELCHLLHDGGERDLLTVVSRPEDHVPIEQRANGFAPSFIAPSDGVRLDAEDAVAQVVQLAYRWGFTFEGAVWHAKNLQLIRPDDAEALVRGKPRTVDASFEAPVGRLSDPLLDAGPTPLVRGLLSDRVVRALSEGHISKNRALEILRLE